ncbi:dsRBD fold-containing protein [Streptomyces sp. XY332]|uniref:dsRBD fold-containing protein n=1 Tax=Streptomyces sp. XY332 TaxID=1415561 RepID=UPI0006B15073|nr:dsRBD fold-containing protein [Streptomyces sp. XY332]KOY53733.1 hypothetical protein ADK59_34250 [Streptomyces sp. XY332]
MSHIAEWKVRLYLFEEGHTTKARLELDTGTNRLTGHGTARCAPQDADVPEIGDELAVARAMEDLALQMKRAAYGDMRPASAPSLPEPSSRTSGGWTPEREHEGCPAR